MRRRGFLVAGVAALAGAPLGGSLALAADDDDLAWIRVLIAAELLAAAYCIALLRLPLGGGERATVRALARHTNEHYSVLAPIVGPTAATGGDFDFAFPAGSFSSKGKAFALGVQAHTAILGAYVGAAAAVKDATLRPSLAGLAASAAQHLSALTALATGTVSAGSALPRALSIDQASDALSPYLG